MPRRIAGVPWDPGSVCGALVLGSVGFTKWTACGVVVCGARCSSSCYCAGAVQA